MASSGSWLEIPKGSHFSIANIPFGIISTPPSTEKHAGVAIGDHVLDLHQFARHQGFSELPDISAAHTATFSQPALNEFAAVGQAIHAKSTKRQHQSSRREPSPERSSHSAPAYANRGYTDFFAGKNHAYNCGCIFRDPAKALQPNYLHLPVAYNSRASSVVPSGTDIRRPLGQFLDHPSVAEPNFGPSRKLDIEVELGALLCRGNKLGQPINVNEAEDHIFGFVLLNDWSARDIQAWEAVPLGPFNSKTFASTISSWVVLKSALEPFQAPGISNETKLHPYLQETRRDNVYDINLEVQLSTIDGETATLSRTNGRNLVFSFPQMIAHHTIGGCPLNVGDLIGSGTISGTEPGTLGSLLETSNRGKQQHILSSTVERKFLEDGDRVTIRGWAGGDDEIVGFGECSGAILPSLIPSWLEA